MTVYILVDPTADNRFSGVFTDHALATVYAQDFGYEVVTVKLPLPAVTA
jgi:hypothetical protein